MKPDKYKKKDYLAASRVYYDTLRKREPKIHLIKDEDEIDELSSKGVKNVCGRSIRASKVVTRFLRKHIGKKWDDVYSLLVEKIGYEREIRWLVELHAFKKDNLIQCIGHYNTHEVRGFYVLDGILGENKIPKWKKDTSSVKVTFVEGYGVFKNNGLFFKAPIAEAMQSIYAAHWYNIPRNYYRSNDFVRFPLIKEGEYKTHCISSRYIRPLSSKEISNWELPNTEINS